ncbi:MAG: type I DNA topoisomerase [Corynebacterium sp.]|nr:type I DNA topoisomerase [Corynebacterium sp.]
MTKRLVIVESQTKATKIGKYLGPDYIVEASIGHIRDLPRSAADIPTKYKKEPWARLGVDIEHDFRPLYLVSPDKKKKVADLKKKLSLADELYLATDPDREGEAIAWHLLETLKPKIPVRRMTFNEITPEAIRYAAEHTRELDGNLVDAQEARRILDRLYGYEVSPVLWKKVMPRLSAGRVQSVATRVIVERERERMAFVSAEYWDLEVTADTGKNETPRTFPARLTAVAGTRVAQGKDFSDRGEVKPGVVVLTRGDVATLKSEMSGDTLTVSAVEEKPYTRKPYAPFMTSTLQQEAGRKLHFTSERTMRIAQRLYENGHITYMRTDSTTLSESGLAAAREAAIELFGSEYVSPSPRQYTRKVKNAQEAHEAIRPAGERFLTPGELHGRLDAEEFRLYELIWARTVASQMADARGTSMKVTLDHAGPQKAQFTATGRTVTFPGFLKVYADSSDDKNQDTHLPALAKNQQVTATDVEEQSHSTNPPARYTEASLVKKMEELGIGRPSTYASIIKTIQDRGYVYSRGNALVPSWVAFAVVGLLEQNFGTLVDYDFTSDMEDQLDQIAAGHTDRTVWLKGFYFGDTAAPADSIPAPGGLHAMVGENLENIDARTVNSLRLFEDPEGRPIVVRVGRYGPYLERRVGTSAEGEPVYERANLPENTTPDEVNLDFALKLFATPQGGRELGENPQNGRMVLAKDGRYGPYVTEVVRDDERVAAEADAATIIAGERAAEDEQRAAEGKRAKNWETKTAQAAYEKRLTELVTEKLKPQTASLFSSMDVGTVTLEEALQLFTLPRVVGQIDGEEVTAQNGPYGPYLKKGTDSRTIGSEEQLFTITLEEAKAIYAQPKQRGRAAAKPPLKTLGNNDVSGKPMVVKDGRFGPYVTDGKTNASLKRGDNPETLTDARANELLSERRAREAAGEVGGTAKKATRKTTGARTRKATAKKPPQTTKRVVKATH